MPKPIEKPWKFKKFEGDFSEIELSITDESKQVFEQAKPDQGFVGLVDLKTGNVHLIPCFNYPKAVREKHLDVNGEDDLAYYSQWRKNTKHVGNKYGDVFSVVSATGTKRNDYYVTTIDDLGTNTGVAHGNAISLAGLSLVAGEQGGVIGFGVWKGDNSLIREFRDRSASQNRHAIAFSAEFLDAFLSDRYKDWDPEGYLYIQVSRARSLPQEIGNKIKSCLLAQLPCENGVNREIEKDDRVFSFPNPFISAVENGDRKLMNAYLGAGMHINEIGNSNQWTALHACANLDEDHPEKMTMLMELITNKSIRFDIQDNEGNFFYDFLTDEELLQILPTINALAKSEPEKDKTPLLQIVQYCMQRAISDKNTKMIGNILEAIDFQFLSKSYPKGSFWKGISNSEYSLDAKAKQQLKAMLMPKFTVYIDDIYKQENAIVGALKDILLSVKDNKNLSYEECQEFQQKLEQLHERAQGLEPSVLFLSDQSSYQFIPNRKALNALPDVNKRLQKIMDMVNNVRLILDDKSKQLDATQNPKKRLKLQ